jgi:poly-gamma-glutamate synthesis protein (capsule biosynthesis protein)
MNRLGRAKIAGQLALIGIMVFAGWWLSRPEPLSQPAVTDSPAETEPRPLRVEARWLLAGEVFWARQMERIASAQEQPYEYLFDGLATLEREKYDAWLAHMECPITDAEIPFEIQATALIFNCRPDFLEEFKDWFTAVSLANNHMDNVGGEAGLIETRANLESVGIQYYGHFDNSVLDDICEVVQLPVRVVYDDASKRAETLPVALCGYHNVWRLPTEAELAVIERYAGRFLTIVSPQQGAEYQPTADALKVQTYRAMIDHGADIVVASHPHWVQNSEVYRGKLIMYSVGNFMFDQEWSEEVKRGAALDVRLSLDYEKSIEGWLSLNCQQFKDKCRQSADGLMLAKPAFNFDFDLISVYHQGGQTAKAPEAVHQLNLNRTNWPKTISDLKTD